MNPKVWEGSGHLKNFTDALVECKNCHERMKQNPMRLLDCKNEECRSFKQDAPSVLDSLCSPCRIHLKSVLEYLEELGLPYLINSQLVRGLDYYNRTVFEIFPEGDDGMALASGGRYDYLAEMIGGRPTAAGGAGSPARRTR